MRKIYLLTDPVTGQPMYVGQTVNSLQSRVSEHLNHAKRGIPKGEAKRLWLMSLVERGLRPAVTLLEVCEGETWREAERKWIKAFPGLLNDKAGGGGGSRLRFGELPESTRARLGKVADAVLAEELGLSRKAITYYRKQAGIPASFDRTRNTPPPRNAEALTIDLPAECIDSFGKEPDYVLAAKFGVSKKTIHRRRHSAGIKSYGESTGNDGKIKLGEPHRRWSKDRPITSL